jgi:hypothetical protein
LLNVNYFCRSATTIFAGRHQVDSRFDSRSYDILVMRAKKSNLRELERGGIYWSGASERASGNVGGLGSRQYREDQIAI